MAVHQVIVGQILLYFLYDKLRILNLQNLRNNYSGLQIQLLIVTIFACGTALAENPSLSSYGSSGLIDIPTAYSLDENALAFTVSSTAQTLRNSATFQILPRISGTFRYTLVDGYNTVGQDRRDRSFDIQFLLLEETRRNPTVAVGLRDFIGTGIYSSEYLVASKAITNKISVTAGLGWGRLSGRNSFDNPLTFLGLEARDRPDFEFGTASGGSLESTRWFQGQASFFGGVEWAVNKNLKLQFEYLPDEYFFEARPGVYSYASPLNVGLQYSFNFGLDLKAYVIGGENAGVQFSYFFDPQERNISGGREPAPIPIAPRSSLAAASWNVSDSVSRDTVLRESLLAEGLHLDKNELRPYAATIYVTNERWDVEAQAAGRAARVLANTLPPQIEEFTVVFQEHGVPISAVTTNRSDLEDLQYDYDAAWRTLARADIADANLNGAGEPKLSYNLGPYSAFGFFDPQSPIRADFGVQLEVSYQAAPGLTFDVGFRYPLVGNLDEAERESDSLIQRVRSESFLFARESDFEINRLTAEYVWRPAPDTFARVTAGYLEDQYGGVSSEVLWSPINSRFALGAEVNYVKQRDFDMLFGFQDYDVVTGHASAYYDLGNGFQTQVDAGRYLAGDWGGTLTVNREFNNGVKIGGYFTLTDVSFDDFGEGSFDKGLTLEVPLSFFTGEPSRRVISQTIQPLLRDGGARLKVQNRLYPLVRDYRGPELSDGWGRYLR